MTTAGESYRDVPVNLTLYDGDGTLLLEKEYTFVSISPDTWQSIPCGTIVSPEGGAFRAVFTFPRLPAGAVSLRLCGQGGEPAQLNGETAQGNLSISVLKSSGFLTIYYWAIAAASIALIIVLWWLLFVRKVKVHILFAVFSLGFGTIFLFVFTPYSGMDEFDHINLAYYYSDVWMGAGHDASNPKTFVWQCRAEDNLSGFTVERPTTAQYAHVYENLFSRAATPDEHVEASTPRHGVAYQYYPATFGVTLARAMGFGQVPTLYFGSFFNLLFYTVVICFTLYFVPFKTLFFLLGSFPYMMCVAGTFSYDIPINAFALFFVGYTLFLACRDGPVTWKSFIPLLISGALLAPLKIVYYPLLLLPLIIPLKNWRSRKRQAVFILAALVAGAAGIAVAMGPSLFTVMNVGSDTADYGGLYEAYTYGYLLKHPGQFVRLIGTSIIALLDKPLDVPGTLHMVHVKLPLWVSLLSYALMLLSIFPVASAPNGTLLGGPQGARFTFGKKRKWYMAALIFVIYMLVLAGAIPWTPVGGSTLAGVQGRYLIPVFPLAFLLFHGWLMRPKDNDRTLVLIMALLNLYALLHVFILAI